MVVKEVVCSGRMLGYRSSAVGFPLFKKARVNILKSYRLRQSNFLLKVGIMKQFFFCFFF